MIKIPIMKFTAQQIASLLGGRIEGNPEAEVQTFAKIEEGVEGAISFLANPHYEHYIYKTASSVVLVNEDLVLSNPVKTTLIRVPNAYEAIARLLNFYESNMAKRSGIHPWRVFRIALLLVRIVMLVLLLILVITLGLGVERRFMLML